MEKRIIKLTTKDISLLPEKVQKKVKGKYCLEMDGIRYYGFHSAKDIHRALKPQPYQPYIKL
jgi:hypothetical protein